jgi:enoyl-CoA hydratase
MQPIFEALQLTVDDQVASLELLRSATGNAFDDVMHREFVQALKILRDDPDIRVILLTGAGRVFSAGGDFGYIHRLRSDPILREAAFKEGVELFDLLSNMHVPIVVAVHGHAMGLGATVATMCDVIVAWKGAKIADPHVHVGLVAGDGGVISWTSAIGFNRARRYLLTGDALTGAQAFECGLVTDLAETPEAALETARAIAARIAALPPIAVQGTKRAFNALAAVRNGDAQRIAFEAEQVAMMSEDIAEALSAASERRTGIYRNR